MNTSPDHVGSDATSQTLALCKHRWEQLGLPADDIDEMLDELRAHLDDAAADGREPAQVLGPRPEEFIREWALARSPRWQRQARRAGMSLVVAVVLLLLAHLLQRTTSVEITPGFLIYVTGICALELFWRPKGRPLTFPRYLLASAVLLVPVLALHTVFPDALFRVPLWLTGAMAALTAAAAVIAIRRDRAGQRR